MAGKRKPRRLLKPTLPKPRDPFWRVRRALVEKRKESAKAYKRAASRRAERKAREEHD